MKAEYCDLPLLYIGYQNYKWCPYKQGYMAGHARCSTKPLSKILISIFTAVKTGLQTYYTTCFSRGGVNQMWILKNSKGLLEF